MLRNYGNIIIFAGVNTTAVRDGSVIVQKILRTLLIGVNRHFRPHWAVFRLLSKMKTNQVMIRPMGQFKVEQRTRDAMFNATMLLRQWNEANGDKKELKDFFRNESTKSFIDALIAEENLNGEKSPYLSARGKNGGTWMHPYLFVKFAMWLNPRFEVKVIKFVYDQMIEYRNEAGNAYRELGSAVSKIVSKDFMASAMSKIAEGMNYCVFGKHETLIRNQHGEEKKMRELFQFERKVADLINEGFLKSFEKTMAYLRKMWAKMQAPKLLEA